MGYFKNIKFNNYRNFSTSSLSFIEKCNILIGRNGTGKTNILEGISLFEKGRGFRKEKILNLINLDKQEQGFKINSCFRDKKIDFNIDILSSEKNLKKISVNNNFENETIKYFQSLFSIICFLPEMERLFVASPSFRRNFLDRLIFSSDKNYNLVINNYKKLISERFILLKQNTYDENWMNKIESNIVKFGSAIYQKRITHLEIINSILRKINIKKNFCNEFFLNLQDNFLIENNYIYKYQEKYLDKIKRNRQNDFLLGGCSLGPHRSDIVGYNTEKNINLNQLSTGQQKTIVLLIIIAQSEYLIKTLSVKPIILMDEICSHLDVINRELLLYLIDELHVQVFMTGTEENFFSFLSTKANYCNIT